MLEALCLHAELLVVNQRDLLSAFFQEHRSCAALILAAHGKRGRGVIYPVVTEHNGVIGREDLTVEGQRSGVMADADREPFVLSTSCSTDCPRLAQAFAGSGFRHLLAHNGANAIDGMLCYVTVLFTLLRGADREDECASYTLTEAHAMAAAVLPFPCGTRGYSLSAIST